MSEERPYVRIEVMPPTSLEKIDDPYGLELFPQGNAGPPFTFSDQAIETLKSSVGQWALELAQDGEAGAILITPGDKMGEIRRPSPRSGG